MTPVRTLTCACGKVHFELDRTPIVSAECHCTSCREAGARLEALPGAPAVREQNGGTRFVLYRKDRVRIVEGAGLLRAFFLAPTSTTRRVIAGCCNTPMFLEFKGGHWLSLYATLWPAQQRPLPQLRTMTSDRTSPEPLGDDIPSGPLQSATFFAGLLGAWIAMGFKVPKVPITGTLEA